MTNIGVSQQNRAQSQAAGGVIDRARALARVDGDGELMVSLVDIFFTESAPLMEAIRTAVTSGDPVKLEKTAHRLKGSVSVFGAEAATQTAFELEKIGRDGNLTNAAEIFFRLEQQMASLQPALKQFRSELHPS